MGCYGNGTSNEWPYGQWRQIAAATPGTVNGKPNVAAMIHRQPAPPRGWPSLDVTNTNIQRVALRPMAAGCRRYTRYVNGIRNVAAMIHRQPAPARGWPRWMFGIRTSNEWPYGQVAAGCRRYIRYVQRYTQCSGDDPSPSSPARGWLR